MHRMQQVLDEFSPIGAPRHRIDIVSPALETRHDFGVAQMPMKQKGASKKRKTFGEPMFQRFTEAAGRFVDLLPMTDEDATGRRTAFAF